MYSGQKWAESGETARSVPGAKAETRPESGVGLLAETCGTSSDLVLLFITPSSTLCSPCPSRPLRSPRATMPDGQGPPLPSPLGPSPPLTRLQAEEHVDWLFNLLQSQGHADYIGESISQLEHCLQAAHFAEQEGAVESTVIAALLHDVGQFIPLQKRLDTAREITHAGRDDGAEMMQDGISVGRMGHDRLGEEWLRQHHWPESVSTLVGAHVIAKRYVSSPVTVDQDEETDARLIHEQIPDRNVSRLPAIPFERVRILP